MPASAIRERLGLTKTQFDQICQKVLKKPQRRSLTDMTLEQAAQKTRWLIEEKLGWPIDDYLPRQITRKHFTDNDLYDCIRFAEINKKADEVFRHFPAVAFLVCHAYPGHYRPFQFRHAKSNQYFRGPGGKTRLIRAIRWIIEEKLMLDIANLDIVAKNKYFLRVADLEFYGIGAIYWREHFANKDELVAEVLRTYQIDEPRGAVNIARLRETLQEAGIDVTRCACPGCDAGEEAGIEIHHIFPKSRRFECPVFIHSADNLVPLYPNHHSKAAKFNWRTLPRDSTKWRQILIDYLLSSE